MEDKEKKEEQTVVTKEEVTPAKETETEVKTEVVPELTDAEKLKKREAEMTRGMQKTLEEKKTAEKQAQLYKDIVSEWKKIAQDENLLIDLHYLKPDVAQGILNEYYGGISFDEFVKSKELNDNIPAKIEAQAQEKANEIIRQREIDLSVESFQKDMWYDDDTMKAFKEELEEIVWDKLYSLSPEQLEKRLIKAHKLTILDSEDYKEVKKQEKIAASSGISEWSSAWKAATKQQDPRVKQILDHRHNN